jgi:hypothetical protein
MNYLNHLQHRRNNQILRTIPHGILKVGLL